MIFKDFSFTVIYSEKYTLVGKLLRPGEEPTSYSDEESESSEVGDSKSKDD